MMAESLNLMAAIPRPGEFFMPDFTVKTVKSQIILSWFDSIRGPLTRLLCIVRPNGDGRFVFSFTPAYSNLNPPYSPSICKVTRAIA
jgi:hypothetical protein